jgi:hypothetical protein
MVGNRIGKAFARKQGRADLGDHRTHPPDIGVARQQFESIVKARTGLEQKRKVARECSHFGGAWPTERASAADNAGSAPIFDGLDWQKPELFDPARDFGRGRCRNRAVHDLAVLGQRSIAEIRHAVTAPL